MSALAQRCLRQFGDHECRRPNGHDRGAMPAKRFILDDFLRIDRWVGKPVDHGGTRLHLERDGSRLHLIDPATGRRLLPLRERAAEAQARAAEAQARAAGAEAENERLRRELEELRRQLGGQGGDR